MLILAAGYEEVVKIEWDYSKPARAPSPPAIPSAPVRQEVIIEQPVSTSTALVAAAPQVVVAAPVGPAPQVLQALPFPPPPLIAPVAYNNQAMVTYVPRRARSKSPRRARSKSRARGPELVIEREREKRSKSAVRVERDKRGRLSLVRH